MYVDSVYTELAHSFNELGRYKSVNAWPYCRCQTVRGGSFMLLAITMSHDT